MSSIADCRPNVQSRMFYSIDRAVAALRRELDRLNYAAQVSRAICQHAHAEHDLAGLVEQGLIDVDDLDSLTEAFAGGFDEVHSSHPSWASADRWEPVERPTPEDCLEHARFVGTFDADPAPIIPPPDLEPNAVAWDEWASWSATLDPADRVLEQELAENGCRR